MSVQQLEKALESRRRELDKLEGKRRSLEKRLKAVDERIAEIAGARVAANGRRGGGRAWRGRTARARNEQSLPAAIQGVLAKAGGPMKVTDIAEAVQAGGYRSNAANFRSLVNQTLIKDARFTSAKRAYYQVKK